MRNRYINLIYMLWCNTKIQQIIILPHTITENLTLKQPEVSMHKANWFSSAVWWHGCPNPRDFFEYPSAAYVIFAYCRQVRSYRFLQVSKLWSHISTDHTQLTREMVLLNAVCHPSPPQMIVHTSFSHPCMCQVFRTQKNNKSKRKPRNIYSCART